MNGCIPPVRIIRQRKDIFSLLLVRQAEQYLFHLFPELWSQQAVEEEINHVVHVHGHIRKGLQRQPELIGEINDGIALHVLDDKHGHCQDKKAERDGYECEAESLLGAEHSIAFVRQDARFRGVANALDDDFVRSDARLDDLANDEAVACDHDHEGHDTVDCRVDVEVVVPEVVVVGVNVVATLFRWYPVLENC